MHVRGGWVIGPIMAVLVAACGATGTPSTPPSAEPTATSAAVGSAAPSQSAAATVAAVSPSAAGPSAAAPSTAATPTAAPSPTAKPTALPSPKPKPTPTPTRPPATSPPPSGSQAVGIADFAFAPSTVTVRVGTRVTWTNRQPAIQHTVTADDGSFGSVQLSTGVSFSHVFTTAGTYSYHCTIHPDMTGTVTVLG